MTKTYPTMIKILLTAVIAFKVVNAADLSSALGTSRGTYFSNYDWQFRGIKKTFSYASYALSRDFKTLVYFQCNIRNCELIENKDHYPLLYRDFNNEDGFNSSVQPKIKFMDDSKLILTRDMDPTLKNKNIIITLLQSVYKIKELSYHNVSSIEVCTTDNMNFDVFYTSTDNSDECYQVICRENLYSDNDDSVSGNIEKKFFELAGKTDNSEYSWKPIIVNGYLHSYIWTNLLSELTRRRRKSTYLLVAHFSHDIINTLYHIDENLKTQLLLRSEGNNIVYSHDNNVLNACYKKKSTPTVICRQYDTFGYPTKNFEVNIDQFSSTWETDQLAVREHGDAIVLLLLHRIEIDNIYWKINYFTLIKLYSNEKPPIKIGSKEVHLICSKKNGMQQWITPVPTIGIFQSRFNVDSFSIHFICSYFDETTNEANINRITSHVFKAHKLTPYQVEEASSILQKLFENDRKLYENSTGYNKFYSSSQENMKSEYSQITWNHIILLLISSTVIIYCIIHISCKLNKKYGGCCKNLIKNGRQ